MTDLKLEILASGEGADLVLENEDLVLDEGLTTAVLLSLYTDARADAEEDPLPVGEDPRGWWADEDGDRFGSKLWLVEWRGKLDREGLNRAREATGAALEWLIEDEIASDVTVTASRQGHRLCLNIQITRGTAPQWQQLWDATEQDTLLQVEDAELRVLFY